MKQILAYDIYIMRKEIGREGTQEHDWFLADKFLQFIGDNKFDYDDIYMWFIKLDENMVEKQNVEENIYG